MPTAGEERIVGHLGPDLCGPALPDLDEVLDRLAEVPAEPLGGALLDQRNVAGFGNVYAVELPFVVGVSPRQPVGTVTGLDGLLGLGTAVIRINAAAGRRTRPGASSSSTTTGSTVAAAGCARCAGRRSTAGTIARARGAA